LATALRTCGVCGLEAYTKEDLELFKKDKAGRYGRRNRCKKCFNLRYDKTRETFIENFKKKPRPCYFCGEEITKLEGWDSESIDVHSLDGNHENWNPINKVPTHHGCHISYHNARKSLKQRSVLPYLRKCRVCGLEAQTKEDLDLFKKSKRGAHGRETICKKCVAEAGRKRYHSVRAWLGRPGEGDP